MRISIDLGGLFSFLFGRRKKKQADAEAMELARPHKMNPLTPDDVLNICEQIGAFDEFKVENDSPTAAAVCEAVARIFNAGPKDDANLAQSFRLGFKESSLIVSESLVNMFLTCYYASGYLYE